MKLDNLDREQLATIKRMLADASSYANIEVAHWRDKTENPSAVSPEQSVHVAKQLLDHWNDVETKWWNLEDAVNSRIRALKKDRS